MGVPVVLTSFPNLPELTTQIVPGGDYFLLGSGTGEFSRSLPTGSVGVTGFFAAEASSADLSIDFSDHTLLLNAGGATASINLAKTEINFSAFVTTELIMPANSVFELVTSVKDRAGNIATNITIRVAGAFG